MKREFIMGNVIRTEIQMGSLTCWYSLCSSIKIYIYIYVYMSIYTEYTTFSYLLNSINQSAVVFAFFAP